MKKSTFELREHVSRYPDIHTSEQIESTAHDLENMKYHPMLLVDTPNFLRMTAADLLAEINRLLKWTSEEWGTAECPQDIPYGDFRDKHIGLLLYHYALLYRLRGNESEAWDEINALYEDD